MHVQVGFGQQLLELGVLAFELTQPARIEHVHAAEFGPPFLESGIAETALAAQLLDLHASLGLFDETDGLLFGESASLHLRHSLD